jgi:hypothetical protein
VVGQLSLKSRLLAFALLIPECGSPIVVVRRLLVAASGGPVKFRAREKL